jgi:RHS repeat-associated protein
MQGGAVYVWGSNSNGQLGNKSGGSLTPEQVSGLSGVTQIAAGNATMAVIANSALEVWDSNSNGQLGDGTTTEEHANAFDQGTRTAFAEGANTTFLTRDDGSVMAAGANGTGQLGDGTTADRHSPEAILQLQGIRSVAAGANDTLAVTEGGQLWASGANTNGELGDGMTTEHNTPELVSSQTKVMQASEGTNYSLAVKSEGNVWVWGANASGQLGVGNTTDQHTPQQIKPLSNVIQVAAGESTGLALESNGTVWAWGSDSNGQLGDNQTKTETSPHQVSGLSGIVQIAAGHQFCLALQSNGTVWAWGANASGQLGVGSTTDSHTPVKVKGLTGVQIVQITAGASFAAALTQSGTVYAWGSNSSGQIRNKSEGSTTPEKVSGISSVTQIAAGNDTMAAIANSALEVWGSNSDGQLGDGTTTNEHSPEQIKAYDQGILNTATYTYNGDGLRTSKTVNGATEQFTWDTTAGSTPVALTAGSVSYIYGPDGTPLEQMTGSENPVWYHHDQQGSTRLLTNNTGAVVGTATYNAYGQTTATTGTTTPLGYGGQYTDPETGLIYLRARYYDPTTGQFLTRDPATALTAQPYGYSTDNPVNLADPTGLTTIGACGTGSVDAGVVQATGTVCGIHSLSDGSSAATLTGGGGVGLGLGAGVSAGVQVTTATNVNQLGGTFAYFSVQLLSFSGEIFFDPNNPRIWGVTLAGAGVGGAIGAYIGLTYTAVGGLAAEAAEEAFGPGMPKSGRLAALTPAEILNAGHRDIQTAITAYYQGNRHPHFCTAST